MGQCAFGEGAQAQKCTVNLSPGKSCSGSMSISDSYNWCFLRVKTRPYHFGFRCLVKTLLWKLIIPRYLFFPKFLFFRFFSWVCSQIWVGKKKYQQIIKIAQLYLSFFYTCTNKGHMKIWYFFQNLQYTITIIQIQMSKNYYLTSKKCVSNTALRLFTFILPCWSGQ